MPDSKISALTEDTTPTLDDFLVSVDTSAGSNKKVKVSNVVARRGCRVYKSTNTSIGSGSLTALTSFDGERHDTDAFHDTVTNSGRITIPAGFAGLYLVVCHLEWDVNATGVRTAYLRKNGTDYFGAQRQPAAVGGATTALTVASFVVLADTDYMEVITYQDSGVSLNLLAGDATGQFKQEFAAQRIAA